MTKRPRQGNAFIPILAGLFIVSGASQSAFAAPVPATAQTRITVPVTLTNSAGLDFGRIIPGVATSTLRIPQTSDTIVLVTGNAVIVGSPISRARFTFTAPPTSRVRIRLPGAQQLIRVGGTQQIRIDQFRQDGPAVRTVPASGSVTFNVGARLRILAGQASGQYVGTFNVTADYN
jgi:Domain of unknown function (DUF4402)